MASCRDWLSTCWQASYKGYPFYVEKEDEEGGRRVVVHQFPMRDDPFLEDLGEDQRNYKVTAYIASDMVDVEALAFKALLVSEGEGPLVLPLIGPVNVRCTKFERSWAKDKHGYLAFSLSFVRAGSPVAVASGALIENVVVSFVDILSDVVGTAFGLAIDVLDFADFVIGTAVEVVGQVAGAIEFIRSTVAIFDDGISSDVRAACIEIIDLADTFITPPFPGAPGVPATPGGGNPEYVVRVFEAVRDLGSAMDPAICYRTFAETVDAWPDVDIPASVSPHEAAALRNVREVTRVFRLALLGAMGEAVIRMEFGARPEAITVRGDYSERMEAEMNASGELAENGVFLAVQNVRNSVVEYLSKEIATLAPVVTVRANMALPSLYWAWRLYQEPTRQSELVSRNAVKHPSVMPLNFEAVAR